MDFLATPARRRVLFSALYLSEGAPIGFIWLALPTWLRLDGVPIERITWLTAVLVIPWTFKFAWAPLVDTLRTSHWTLKQWIITAQSVMALTLLPLAVLNLADDFRIIAVLLLVHAFAAATQDVAIDALCISVTQPGEWGQLNGWMQAGMLTGRALMGGGALILARWAGFAPVVLILALLTGGSLLLVAMSTLPPHAIPTTPLRVRSGEVYRDVRLALAQRITWCGLAFAFVGGAAFKSLEVILGPFLVDRGYQEIEIGSFTAGPMIGLMVLGSLTGGLLADRFERRRCVGGSLVLVVAAIALLAISDEHFDRERGPHLLLLLAVTAFGIGLFTASSYAMFMDLTQPGIAATQFSAFMGATNGCESWSSYTIGRMVSAQGYATGMLVMCAVSLAALPLLFLLKLQQHQPGKRSAKRTDPGAEGTV